MEKEVKITIFGKDYILPTSYKDIFLVEVIHNEFIVVSIPEYFTPFFHRDHNAPSSFGFTYYFEFNETNEIQNLLEDYICNFKNYLKTLSSSIESTYGEELKNYEAMKEII